MFIRSVVKKIAKPSYVKHIPKVLTRELLKLGHNIQTKYSKKLRRDEKERKIKVDEFLYNLKIPLYDKNISDIIVNYVDYKIYD